MTTHFAKAKEDLNQSPLTIFLCQLSSTNDREYNRSKIIQLLKQSRSHNPDLIIFPEHTLFRSNYAEIRTFAQEEIFFIDQLSDLSSQYNSTIIWGGIPIIESGKLYNTSLVIDASGNLIGNYKKIHLFQLSFNTAIVNERALFNPGDTPVLISINNWKIGLSICYDLRFPELFRAYTDADLVVCTSEFTQDTGKSHWEVLLRARAIENQCYIAGVNQCGLNESINTRSYGHSMVINPWGSVMSTLDDEEGYVCESISKDTIKDIRAKLPTRNAIKHKITW